jgi:hypothetical protein
MLTDESSIFRNSFQEKRNFEAIKNLIKTRSRNKKKTVVEEDNSDVWKRKPVDFTVKLYHPKPPKRNSRNAIKPWLYDKYLRKIENDSSDATNENKDPDEKVITDIMSSFYSNTNLDEYQSQTESLEFQSSFRCITPNADRIKMSKTMGYRDSLEQYKNPVPHDFRGVKTSDNIYFIINIQ